MPSTSKAHKPAHSQHPSLGSQLDSLSREPKKTAAISEAATNLESIQIDQQSRWEAIAAKMRAIETNLKEMGEQFQQLQQSSQCNCQTRSPYRKSFEDSLLVDTGRSLETVNS